MKALVYTAPSVVKLQDVDEPTPEPDEVVVHVAAAGICGSELHGVRTPGFRVPPLVMGHEFAGQTTDGQRVAVNPVVACGRCDRCAAGTTEVCRHRTVLGIHRPGGFAERVAVPRGALHELPPELSYVDGALVEPLANGVHAWALAGRPAGARVGILGAGTIGLVALLVARRGGAAAVAVADPAADRQERAATLGADETGTTLADEYDVIVDAAGVAATRAASVARLRPGGTAIWLGLAGDEAGFDPLELVRQEKRVVGSFAYTDAEFAEAVALATQVDTSWVHTVPLGQGATVFTDLMSGRTDIVKAVLQP